MDSINYSEYNKVHLPRAEHLYCFINEFFNGGIDINVDIQDIRIKFEEIQPIDISIPTINFPNINVGYTQAA